MLIPACTFPEEIQKKFRLIFYTEAMFWSTGIFSEPPIIQETSRVDDNGDQILYQYACVSKDIKKFYGFFQFKLNRVTRSIEEVFIIRFTDEGRTIFNRDVLDYINYIIKEWNINRMEFRAIGGNPVIKVYRKFIKKFNGQEFVLHDVVKDKYDKYHDMHIFEILLKK